MKNIKSIQILILLLLIVNVSCKQNSKNKMIVDTKNTDLEILIGTYTNDKSKGIYKLTMNPDTGVVNSKEILVEVENPSFLEISQDGKRVYAIQENEEGKVFSYQWNSDKTKLVEVSNSATNGMHPCYVSLNDKGNLLAVANYSSGNFSVYQIDNTGKINNQFKTKQHLGKGTFLPRQENPHAHSVKFYKSNFLYAVDLGIDKILSYSINNKILGEQKLALKTDDGDGPRHLTFHPNKNIAYVTTEFTNAIIVSVIDEKTGDFNRIQKISMLPENYTKESFAADIHLSNDGKFLYASNRGHTSIVTFSIDTDGKLTLINNTDTKGSWPRNFALSKDNKFLLVANQFDNNIVVFKRDEKTGTLTYTGHQIEISTPVFVKFL